MPLFHLGPAGDAFAGFFGGTAAVLLFGGPMLLRWQRNRQQFLLMQTALTQGVTRFPKGPPFWLLSLRQGVTTLTLGIGLLLIGATATLLTHGSTISGSTATTQSAAMTQQDEPPTRATTFLSDLDRRPPAPPPPNPAMEEWHRIQSINSLGLMSLASGFVVALLGISRIGFARTERHYENEEEVT